MLQLPVDDVLQSDPVISWARIPPLVEMHLVSWRAKVRARGSKVASSITPHASKNLKSPFMPYSLVMKSGKRTKFVWKCVYTKRRPWRRDVCSFGGIHQTKYVLYHSSKMNEM